MNHMSDPFSNHISQLSSSASNISGFKNSLFDFTNQGISPSRNQPLPASPLVNAFSISPSSSNTITEVSIDSISKLKRKKGLVTVEFYLGSEVA